MLGHGGTLDPMTPGAAANVDDDGFLAEVSSPILFNTWKHHAATLRRRIERLVGPDALEQLSQQLVVMGTELMDLYTGSLTPGEIAEKVLAHLKAEQRLGLEAYRKWLQASGGYGVMTFPEEGSRWVLRMGDADGRFVHVHPARWAPHTRRVRANVLKTAVMVLAHVRVHGGSPRDVAVINQIRRQHLGLSPIGNLSGDQGLGIVLDILQPKV
jgi:hypothetical protein